MKEKFRSAVILCLTMIVVLMASKRLPADTGTIARNQSERPQHLAGSFTLHSPIWTAPRTFSSRAQAMLF
jgi:hypothetical protein